MQDDMTVSVPESSWQEHAACAQCHVVGNRQVTAMPEDSQSLYNDWQTRAQNDAGPSQ